MRNAGPPSDLPPRFCARPDFSSLSVRDLVDAREAYHVHLTNKEHVVGTALGRYRIRKGDWYEKNPPGTEPPRGWKRPRGPRDLFNSVVAPWSWPCVLVFVDEWVDRSAWSGGDGPELEPDQFVPRSLYLPDGRIVPTCVVLLKRLDARPAAPPPVRFPKEFVGAGYPLFTSVQGSRRTGSVGCLVTDGHNTYALTNRHVTGDEQAPVSTVLAGREVPVGTASLQLLGKRRFDEVYAPWPGRRVFVNLDVGLVKVNDLAQWTTQVLGLGALGGPVDLNPDTLSTDLVDQPVRAFGAVSGPLSGRIAALFYRYQEMGGFEYVSDLLIALDAGSVTHPGDSGTLWCLVRTGERETHHPIALEWGGQAVEEPGREPARSVTLATFVSTVLRELQLDLIRDWNVGLPYYWGALGHYTIAARACSAVAGSLRTLLEANLDRITFPDANLTPKTFKGLSKKGFVPLADVPDYVWKSPGGPAHRTTENPSHFASMDRPLSDGPDAGMSLLQLCADPKNVTPQFWNDYYGRVHDPGRGTLPFRVRQVHEAMVAAAAARDVVRFVACAGVIAHYVGDACQPLHISYLFNGDPDRKDGGKEFGRGVHAAYEAGMVNAHGPEILSGVSAGLEATSLPPNFRGGEGAALATVDLMGRTFRNLSPMEIVNAYAAGRDLWESFGSATVKTLVQGVLSLGGIWQSAWEEGGGDSIPASKLVAVVEDDLVKLYSDPTFIPSLTLDQLVAAAGPLPARSAGRAGKRGQRARKAAKKR
ncbi:MAG: hypothetical protein ACM3JH_06330 [Acidithiobacillales bacterium]